MGKLPSNNPIAGSVTVKVSVFCRLAADAAYGAASMLNWLIDEKGIARRISPCSTGQSKMLASLGEDRKSRMMTLTSENVAERTSPPSKKAPAFPPRLESSKVL